MHPIFWLLVAAIPFAIWIWWSDRDVIKDKHDAHELYRRGREGAVDRLRGL